MPDLMSFADIQTLAHEIIEADADRNAVFDAMERAWNLDPEIEKKAEWFKTTISPDPHNAVKWVIDLLISNEPLISIPYSDERVTNKDAADRLEKGLKLILDRASRQRGKTVLSDVALSGTVFDTIAMKLVMTQDIAESVKGKDKQRFTELAKKCPFLVEVFHPKHLHVAGSVYGPDYVVENRSLTVSEIRRRWGSEKFKDASPTDTKEYFEFWDDHQVCKWLRDDTAPLQHEEYKLGFIPYVYVTNGSTLFETQPKMYPMLYAAIQSKVWQRQSLMLSTMATQVFSVPNPTLVYKTPDRHQLERDAGAPGNAIAIRTDEEIYPLNRDVITPDMQQMWAVLSGKLEESTVPKILGGHTNLSSAIAYSTLNLVTQSGRLVVQPIQELVAWGLAELCEKILSWIVYSGKAVKLRGQGQVSELKPSDIDKDWIEVHVELKPDYPQDRLQIGNLVTMLNKSGMISKETAREMMGFMQPKDEETKLLEEVFTEIHVKEYAEKVGQDTGLAALIEADKALEVEPPPEAMPGGMPGVPPVMQQGAPPPEFMQAAAENMSPQEAM